MSPHRDGSGFRGVCRGRTAGKWLAYVHYRGRVLRLGEWDSREEAAAIARTVRQALMPLAVD